MKNNSSEHPWIILSKHMVEQERQFWLQWKHALEGKVSFRVIEKVANQDIQNV